MSLEQENEIREIAIAANSGEATEEQIARLDELVRSDRQLANYLARMLDQQAALAWQGSMYGVARDEICGANDGEESRYQLSVDAAGGSLRSTPATQTRDGLKPEARARD